MGAIIPTTLYLFWDGCDKLTDHHNETTQDILSQGEGEADGTSKNGSGEPAGDTDVTQPPAAASQRSTNGRIKTLEDFTAKVPDIDDLDDFLRCTAEEMAKILVEHSALLKGGTMGDKQRRELLQEAMIRKYTKEKLASEVVEVLCKAADGAGAQLTSGAGAGSAEKAGPELLTSTQSPPPDRTRVSTPPHKASTRALAPEAEPESVDTPRWKAVRQV